MDRIPPVPTPRATHSEEKRAECRMLRSTSKKPVPLPRLKIFNELDCKSAEINSDDLDLSERQTCGIANHVSENSNRGPCIERIRLRNLKEEWKIECDDAQLKGKSVIGKTRTVGASIEKSVRNMIAKRMTVRGTTPNKINDFSAKKSDRSQSLPSGDIFQSISFISPIENVQKELEMCEDAVEEVCVSTSGAPPPVYPPPPLPDESVYDEVHSVVSSHSSSYEPYCDSNITDFETLYEDITQVKENCRQEPFDPSQKKTEGNNLENSESSVESQHRCILRSDSWSFYDAALEKDIYQNVSPSDISSFDGSDSMIYNTHCSSKLSCAESTLSSLQEDLNCDNSDEISEGESCTNSNTQFSRQHSVNIWNDMYENWETNIPQRRAKEKHRILTKSVILEFDPLYETDNSCGTENNRYTEVFLPDDAGETDSPYGRINRVVISEEPEDKIGENEEFVCPPVPPRRYDSISVVPAEENRIVGEPANERSPEVASLPGIDVNHRGLSPEKGESEFTSDSNSDGNVDGAVGRSRKTALVRWASMKRAIQMMADGSSFRRAVRDQLSTEDKLGYQNSLFYREQNEASSLVTRPNLTPNVAIQRSGILYRAPSCSKDYTARRCILAEGKLSLFTDKSGTSISEVIPLNKLLSIQFVPECKPG
jgi:hypothetical protein